MALHRVAITGMGVVSPIGQDCGSFFDALLRGQSGLQTLALHYPHGDDSVVAGTVDFDGAAHIARARLITMDRCSQMATVAAREALAQAGLLDAQTRASAYLPDRMGVAIGTGMGGSGSTDAAYTELLERKATRLRPMTVVLAMHNATAAHLTMDLQLLGASLTVSNACASSAMSIGEAARHIRHGYADAMLAGGTDALLNRGTIKAWQAMHTLAKPHADGAHAACRPFATDRSGLVLAEGAAMLVLENWDHAVARGASILAELAGYATTTDAAHLTQPDMAGQARAMALALADAAVAPAEVGYLNAHGTATDVGDVTEAQAIAAAFGAHAGRLPVSSTKALHGHTMGAAGAMELVASVLALRSGQLPPTAFLDQPDPRCPLHHVRGAPQAAPDLEVVVSNSFAFGGSNAVLVLRRAA